MSDDAIPLIPLAEMPVADRPGEPAQTRLAREEAMAAARETLRSFDVKLAQLERLAAIAGRAADDNTRTGRLDIAAKWREAMTVIREGRGLDAIRMLRAREALAAILEGWSSGVDAAHATLREDEARVEDIWTRIGKLIDEVTRLQRQS